MALAEEKLGGIGDLAQAFVGHFEHADLVGRAKAVFHRAQDAEMVAAFALEIEHAVDHVLDNARPGNLAVLGDMADQHDRGTRRLGIFDHRLRRGAHLGDGARRRFGDVSPQRLDRIEDHEIGPLAVSKGGENVLDIGFGREFDRRIGRAEPLRAQAHLGDGLLAGDVDDAVTLFGQRSGSLHQKGRLADAGIAADQKR